MKELNLTEIPEENSDHLLHYSPDRVALYVLHGDGQVPQVHKPHPVLQSPELLLPDLRVLTSERVPELHVVLLAVVDDVGAADDDLQGRVGGQRLLRHRACQPHLHPVHVEGVEGDVDVVVDDDDVVGAVLLQQHGYGLVQGVGVDNSVVVRADVEGLGVVHEDDGALIPGYLRTVQEQMGYWPELGEGQERVRGGETETERDRDRQTDGERQTHRQTERQTD